MHPPVLLKEAINILDLKEGDVYLDATLGHGGHTLEVLRRMSGKITIAGIDADEESLEKAKSRLDKEWQKTGKFAVLNFRNIKDAPHILGIPNPTKILFDLGWNKSQFEEGGRGFSFQKDEPLNMAYGKSTFDAYTIVNSWEEENIKTIISAYGEEKFAGRIAKAIVEARITRTIKSSKQLAEIIISTVPLWYRRRKIHPATKTFQALRIAVNDELNSLQVGLEGAFETLEKEGRIAVISFHSLEDRIVKRFFRNLNKIGHAVIINKKPIKPAKEEIINNPSSRSAKLRAIIKK